MCDLETSWFNEQMLFTDLPLVLERLDNMKQDGLIELNMHQLKVTPKGRPFVRNVCMAFDLRLHQNVPDTRLFSMTI
jgi:oxygen-independent coproporphyrinogen-3 oxidase